MIISILAFILANGYLFFMTGSVALSIITTVLFLIVMKTVDIWVIKKCAALFEKQVPAMSLPIKMSSKLMITIWFKQLSKSLFLSVDKITNERDEYLSTLDTMNDLVIRTDKHGRIQSVNNACHSLLKQGKWQLQGELYTLVNQAINQDDKHISFSEVLTKISTEQEKDKLYKTNFHINVNNQLLAIEQQVKGVYTGDTWIGTVIVLRDVTIAEKMRERLRYQANHDSVTKLYNRYKFEQRLVDAWHDAQENDNQHALLQLDMDRFKLINDNAGHAAGDQLLREVGHILKSTVRQTDICARVGGDEFAVLLYNVTERNVQNVMNKLNTAFHQLPFSFHGHVFDVAASIGGTIIDKFSPPLDEVKRQADTACYIAKNNGINGNELFNLKDERLLLLQQESQWAARIHQAIEKNEFTLFYQPIKALDLADKGKQHLEILLRLRSGEQLLSPNVFLPAVERFRLSTKVDFWVVSKVFEWLQENPRLWKNQVIAINLSGDSIINEGFIDDVLNCHAQCDFPSSAICFEITETAAIANMTMATRMVEKLCSAGFSIALDDFGKGFSTFSYLKSLPAQYIKIDGSYVQDILENASDASIVKAIATMAKNMDMLTIAEFVQCDESKSMLHNMGVNYVQGFGIEKPSPLASYQQNSSIQNAGIIPQETIAVH